MSVKQGLIDHILKETAARREEQCNRKWGKILAYQRMLPPMGKWTLCFQIS